MINFSLLLVSLVLVIGRIRPDPPETNFFLLDIAISDEHQNSAVFFTDSFSTQPEPLCIPEDDPKSASISLLAHKICTASKFPTFIATALVPSSSVTSLTQDVSSHVTCLQDEYFEIVCSRYRTSPRPCSFLQVTCGPCHYHVHLQPNSSVQLMSPLYPVLQPGLVCQYDLQLPQDISADISIEVADLSLNPAQSSPSGQHCVSSFLHILGGATFLELKSIATLCGLLHYPSDLSYYKIDESSVRLLMVAGSSARHEGRRGFQVNVYVSPSRMKIPLHKIIILLAFFGVLILILSVLASVIIYLNRKSKIRRCLPRRRQTWHGSVPTTGENVHQSRTERIRHWGTDNLYMFDNSVNRRGLPELPAFNFASVEQDHETDADNSGFKVYESLSHCDLDLSFSVSDKASLPPLSPPSLPERPTPP